MQQSSQQKRSLPTSEKLLKGSRPASWTFMTMMVTGGDIPSVSTQSGSAATRISSKQTAKSSSLGVMRIMRTLHLFDILGGTTMRRCQTAMQLKAQKSIDNAHGNPDFGTTHTSLSRTQLLTDSRKTDSTKTRYRNSKSGVCETPLLLYKHAKATIRTLTHAILSDSTHSKRILCSITV